MNNFDELRRQIDEIDEKIISLLASRVSVVEKIGQIKKKNNIPFLDLKRKKEMLAAKMESGKKLGIPSSFVKGLFELIHDSSVKIQEKLK